jgi:hypothetical protein
LSKLTSSEEPGRRDEYQDSFPRELEEAYADHTALAPYYLAMVGRTVVLLEHEHARASSHIGGHEQRTGLGNVEDVASKRAIAAAMDDQCAT